MQSDRSRLPRETLQNSSPLQRALEDAVLAYIRSEGTKVLLIVVQQFDGVFSAREVRLAVNALAQQGRVRVFASGHHVFVRPLGRERKR